ncbi:MAG: DNA-binding protein [Thermodesulfobacteriota bacterium]
MKKLPKIMVGLGILSLLLATYAWAQPAGPGAGQGMKRRGGMGLQYDPNKLETVKGEVIQVQKGTRRSKGVHLEVKTDKETLIAILGPASFLEQQKMDLAVGDKVEITGSRIERPQKAIILAGEVKKGDQAVKLRDEKGMPLWRRSLQKK